MIATPQPTVVKVGGSLFDLPDLGKRLESFLSSLNTQYVVLVPGGGPAADLVRQWDANFDLGAERAHWLALGAMTFNAHFLASILRRGRVSGQLEECSRLGGIGLVSIIDAHAWVLADEKSSDALPHGWNVTSDSVAARVAIQVGASELILLKSVAISDEGDWSRLATSGVVDKFLPEILKVAPGLRVRLINLRTYQREFSATL